MSQRIWTAIIALAWLLILVPLLWPVGWWLHVESIHVADGRAGQPVILQVDRTIRRPFFGEWTTVIRRVDGRGETVACVAAGESDYRTSAVLPDPLTLDWWTDGRCPTLAAGTYRLSTTWLVEPGPLPRKFVTVDSNTFAIAP